MAMYKKLNQTAERIEAVLRDRRAPAAVVGGKVLPGFVEMLLQPAPGTKVNQVKALQADLALALGNTNVRVAQSGAHLAVQIPSETRRPVHLSTLMSSLDKLPAETAILGLAEDGAPLMAKLSSADVAHVLIAGTTGSGKSSLAQTMLVSLATGNRPHQLGFVVIDPKASVYSPFLRVIEKHLLLPVARGPEQAIEHLHKVVQAMEQRNDGTQSGPRVVMYVDELADLCMSGGAPVVEMLTRIAQRGRGVGIHLIACTQKPSSSAMGPLLGSNLPLRLVGRVVSATDARVATGIPASGAEKLLGNGDFIAVTAGTTIRFQAAMPK
jgi:S-DNA-T family DNA segregation ATPase FtsK/SpoIIIE